MSDDTTALLVGAPNQEEVAAALRLAFPGTKVETERAIDDNMYRLYFVDPVCKPRPGDAKRRMMYVFHAYDSGDYRDVFDGTPTVCSLGAFGGSVRIMDALAKHFGGFVRDADNSSWRSLQAEEAKVLNYSPEDRLRITLASVAGPVAGAAIASLVIDDAEKLEAVTHALADYAAETSVPAARP